MMKFCKALLIVSVWLGVALPAVAQQDSINLGEVRVVNALVAMGEVDVYLNDSILAYNLPPEQATIYFAIPPGRHNLAVRLAGSDRLSVPVADMQIDLAANQSLSAIAYQEKFTTAEGYIPPFEQAGRLMILEDNRSPAALGRTRLTAVHVAPGVSPSLSVAYTNRASLLHEISLQKPFGSIDVDAGAFQLVLVDAASPTLNILERIGQLNFNGNTLYTLVIVPDLVPEVDRENNLVMSRMPTSPRAFVISAALERPENGFQLRVIHAAHSTAIVDVYIDERLIVPRMNYSQATEYLSLSDYSHTITLRRRDADPTAPPLATARINITESNRAQQQWTLLMLNANSQSVTALDLINNNLLPGEQPPVVIDTPGGPMVLVLVPDNVAQTARGTVRVRLIHAVDGALDLSLVADALPTTRTQLITPAPGPTATPLPPVALVEGVVYGTEASDTETVAGLYQELEFVVGGATTLATLRDIQLIDGIVYTFVLVGLPAGEPPVRALVLEDFGRGIPQERLYRGVVNATVELVNVRERDTIQSNVQGSVTNGSTVEVIGRNQDASWVLIRYIPVSEFQPREGWISSSLIIITRLGDPVNALSLPQVRR